MMLMILYDAFILIYMLMFFVSDAIRYPYSLLVLWLVFVSRKLQINSMCILQNYRCDLCLVFSNINQFAQLKLDYLHLVKY